MKKRRFILYKTNAGYLHHFYANEGLEQGEAFVGTRQGAAEFRSIEDAIAVALWWDGARILDAETQRDVRL
jgi:hypothetical protein